MTVQWIHIVIAILTLAISVASGIVGWFISELRLFRKEYTEKAVLLSESIGKLTTSLNNYVLKSDCNVSMDKHCDRIGKLQDKYQELNNRQQRLIQLHCDDGDRIS